MISQLFLIGLPGSAGLPAGKLAAKMLKGGFLDTDTVIAQTQRVSATSAVVELGEDVFRKYEGELLHFLQGAAKLISGDSRPVLGLGGKQQVDLATSGHEFLPAEDNLAVSLQKPAGENLESIRYSSPSPFQGKNQLGTGKKDRSKSSVQPGVVSEANSWPGAVSPGASSGKNGSKLPKYGLKSLAPKWLLADEQIFDSLIEQIRKSLVIYHLGSGSLDLPEQRALLHGFPGISQVLVLDLALEEVARRSGFNRPRSVGLGMPRLWLKQFYQARLAGWRQLRAIWIETTRMDTEQIAGEIRVVCEAK